mmetsp:Transcript_9581/g.15722  ORF Transcript_9581/g.15722 Transcript_9581/m.15722 type:complete len:200 (-) Transcript_9581:131-730(-)|eukprot:CAMPEP_0184335924 /NCGR_PEP_ID=MMETSP1089-20130417/4417_1 /TAXON_ID=38269 ORGANISM="Gloeochaete wittrockiana, Strain SAG46.84" /NCGR_SAMPLE_ID=MMETSP1089 /ASSEMBLY_ACC=CAM_ASM_000445 /LENGTH=199 /DNA_ID=CAMNT_0026660825 /DNA_START=71 /DNA_END=670 /DNA_ORIENTATION=+
MKGGKSTALVSGNRKKIHTTYDDGSELVEEFDLQTDELLVRKFRRKTALGGDGPWVFEIGEPMKGDAPNSLSANGFLSESTSNPVVLRKDTEDSFQWRIRNLPYPKDVYNIRVDPVEKRIVIRTSNKKYFKKLEVPDLERAEIPFSNDAVSFTHANNTLVVSYKKPQTIIDADRESRRERARMKSEKPPRDGDVECNQQ